MASTRRRLEDGQIQHLAMPGESPEYRAARNALLEDEILLRRQIERVNARRRALPPGGTPPQDYVFEGLDPLDRPVARRLSSLFSPGKHTLVLYSFMYGLDADRPCPGCTHVLDSLDGVARHAPQRLDLYIVAKSPLARILAFARDRGWHHLSFLSTAGNTYDEDYFGDSRGLSAAVRQQQDFPDGQEWDQPMLNVFRRNGDAITHFWGSELLYVPTEPGEDYRHIDMIDPLWNLLDTTPEGRGDFVPRLDY